jgi:hypothetical protein
MPWPMTGFVGVWLKVLFFLHTLSWLMRHQAP